MKNSVIRVRHSPLTRREAWSVNARGLDALCGASAPGAPWRDLPEKYGKWITVYQRFRRWSEADIWEAVAKKIGVSEKPCRRRFTPRDDRNRARARQAKLVD